MVPCEGDFDTGLRAADLDPRRPTPIETPWGTMALYRIGAQVYAAQAFCPHLDGPLFEGSLSGTVITCPWHSWRFDLQSGERVDAVGPPSGEAATRLKRCQVRQSAGGTLLLRPL